LNYLLKKGGRAANVRQRSIFLHRLLLVGDDAGATAVGKIGIRPLEQHGDVVAEADQKNQVDEQPRQPCRVRLVSMARTR
jgi:hypothetical protein